MIKNISWQGPYNVSLSSIHPHKTILMKKALTLSLILFLFLEISAQNSLTVGDPRNSWYTYPGSISEASLTVEPKGLFMEYGLYLSFSSEGSPWTEVHDTVEVVLNFTLPPEAVVFDSWLWVGEEIVKADILDKWTASLIYESIVRRRRDPSILTKHSPTQYELRVFPMAGNEIRKVKIAYMMPATWSKQMVSARLPMEIFQNILSAPPYFELTTLSDDSWEDPFLVQEPDLEFAPLPDSTSGSYKRAEIPVNNLEGSLDIAYRNPMKDGLFFSHFEEGNEGIYQLAFFPSDLLDTLSGSKAAVLLDYDASKTHLSIPDLLQMTRNEMLAKLTPRDSFNLFFSKLSIHRYSEEWIAATPENIEAAFASLDNPLATYSNLASLLADGVSFIQSQGGKGQMVLISNADQYDQFQQANTLINDLLALMDPPIPIHIADYQSRDISWSYYRDVYYRGNGYLYTNLAKLTGGSCQRYLDGYTTEEAIGSSMLYLGGSIHSFDLHTTMDNGFCHSRYLVNGQENLAYVQDAIMQVGRYKGDFPFKLALSGVYADEVFSKELVVEETAAIQTDTLAEEIWTGQYIHMLEAGYQSNDVINEIIYQSLTERVLSKYTSFLCLEPGMNPDDFEDPGEDDDRIFISVEDQPALDSISVYPNPFTDFVTIEIRMEAVQDIGELAIYSMTGSLLHRFDPEELQSGPFFTLNWNGTAADGNPVDPGVYLLVYRSASTSKTIKLIKQ